MRFNITNVLLAFAIHSSIVSSRPLLEDPKECQKSLQACSDSSAGCAPSCLLQLRAGVPPPKFIEGDGEGVGGGTPLAPPKETGPGDEPTEGPITGNKPDEPTTPDGSPTKSTGDTPPPKDPNQPLSLQNPTQPEVKNTFRDTIQFLKNPRAADDPTPRLPKDKGFLWSIHDQRDPEEELEDDGGLSSEAESWARDNGYVSIEVLKGFPGNLIADENNDVVDEYIISSSAAFARALEGEVQMVADAKGLGADNLLAKHEWNEMMDAGTVTAIRWRDSQSENFQDSKIIWTKDQGPIPPPTEGTQRIDELSGSHQ